MGRKKHKQSRRKCPFTFEKIAGDKLNEESTDNTVNQNIAILEQTTKPEIATAQESDIVFEKYFPRSERVEGREYFVHSLCQLCKKDLPERISCEKCSLVSYCSRDHLRLHWPEHSELCLAVRSVCETRGESHILQTGVGSDPECFRRLRYRNMVECEARVQRQLQRWEREAFVFPNVCSECHQFDEDTLVVCERCNHSGFCEGHRTQSHDKWCPHLLNYKYLVKDRQRFGVICPALPVCKLSKNKPKLTNVEDFFKCIRRIVDDLEFLELTEIVTYPLTVLLALLVLNSSHILNAEKLVFHVVGAEREFETNKLEKWELYVLHLMPKLQTLELDFIGPELVVEAKPKSIKICRSCYASKKSIEYKFHNGLYHMLTATPNLSKPDLVCVFNPGLYRTTGFAGKDSWSASIVSMFAQDCPVLSTAYTLKEAHLDVERVKLSRNVRIIQEPTLNPFSSLKPNLNFVSDEDSPVIFKNQFYCIMCND